MQNERVLRFMHASAAKQSKSTLPHLGTGLKCVELCG